MVNNEKSVKKAIKCLALSGMLLLLISSSTAFACHIWADKGIYRPNSVVTLTYDTDTVGGSHAVIIQKDDTPVATFDMGENKDGSVTWNCGPEETSYQAKLMVNNEEYSSTCIKISNDDMAPTTTYSFSRPQKPDGSYDPGVKLSFIATDNPGGSGVEGIYYWYDDECDPRQYSSPIEFNRPGTYALTFKAVDKAGNIEMADFGFRTITFDITAPDTSSTATPAATTRQMVSPTSSPAPLNGSEGYTAIPASSHVVGDNMTDKKALCSTGQANESQTDASHGNDLGSLIRVSAISGLAVIAGAGLLIIRRP